MFGDVRQPQVLSLECSRCSNDSPQVKLLQQKNPGHYFEHGIWLNILIRLWLIQSGGRGEVYTIHYITEI